MWHKFAICLCIKLSILLGAEPEKMVTFFKSNKWNSVCVCVCMFVWWLMFKREVLVWNKGRRLAVLWLDVTERQLRPAKTRSTDLDVYPQSVFHTGNVLSLSSASLAVAMCLHWIRLWVCGDDFMHVYRIIIFFFVKMRTVHVFKRGMTTETIPLEN